MLLVVAFSGVDTVALSAATVGATSLTCTVNEVVLPETVATWVKLTPSVDSSMR